MTAVKWDAYDVEIQQARQDDCIRTSRIHPTFILGYQTEVFIWQNFQPAYQASPALSYEHILTKDLEARRDLRNRASLVNRAQRGLRDGEQYACLPVLTVESLFFEPPWEKKIGSNYLRVWLYLVVRTS